MFLILAFLLGGGLFGYGWYTERKQKAEFLERSLKHAETKLTELLPLLNTIHHQRVQYVIDEYPDLKEKPEIQKQLMAQMDMNIESPQDLQKILASPLESVVPGFSFVNFPKETAWSNNLIAASAMMTSINNNRK